MRSMNEDKLEYVLNMALISVIATACFAFGIISGVQRMYDIAFITAAVSIMGYTALGVTFFRRKKELEIWKLCHREITRTVQEYIHNVLRYLEQTEADPEAVRKLDCRADLQECFAILKEPPERVYEQYLRMLRAINDIQDCLPVKGKARDTIIESMIRNLSGILIKWKAEYAKIHE